MRQSLGANPYPYDSNALSRSALLRRVAADADAVRGLGPSEMYLLFGSPVLVRGEGDVRVDQYAAGGCVMDAYFKPDAVHPVYVEFRLADGQAGHWPCLHALVRGARHDDAALSPELFSGRM